MFQKKSWVTGFIVVLFLGFVMPATAQMKRIYKFQNVKVPFGFTVGDKEIPKGTYHFEFLRHQKQAKIYLRICKDCEFLCCTVGNEKNYAALGGMLYLNSDTPNHPRMQILRDLRKKELHIDFESGKLTSIYPFLKASFTFPLAA